MLETRGWHLSMHSHFLFPISPLPPLNCSSYRGKCCWRQDRSLAGTCLCTALSAAVYPAHDTEYSGWGHVAGTTGRQRSTGLHVKHTQWHSSKDGKKKNNNKKLLPQFGCQSPTLKASKMFCLYVCVHMCVSVCVCGVCVCVCVCVLGWVGRFFFKQRTVCPCKQYPPPKVLPYRVV